MSERMISDKQKKKIWGFRSAIGLSEEDLYSIIFRISHKESMRALTDREAKRVILELIRLKEAKFGPLPEDSDLKRRRYDQNGREATIAQRQKIYMLCKDIGWDDNNNRVNGFCKRMFKVERVEWLSADQCQVLIESLKKMKARMKNERKN